MTLELGLQPNQVDSRGHTFKQTWQDTSLGPSGTSSPREHLPHTPHVSFVAWLLGQDESRRRLADSFLVFTSCGVSLMTWQLNNFSGQV